MTVTNPKIYHDKKTPLNTKKPQTLSILKKHRQP